MLSKLFLLFSVSAVYVAGNCGPRPLNPQHYEEFNCTSKGEAPCNYPASYTCPDWANLDKSKCHFKGKTYNAGETLESAGPCAKHCTCVAGDKEASFTCALVECPEFLGNRIPPNCVGQYDHDSCCSVKRVCDAEKDTLHKCEFGGKSYLKGQRIYSSYEPCFSCVCDENFNGDTKLEFNPKSCRRVNCNIELFHSKELSQGCSPVYLGQSDCCPTEWKCPAANDKVKNPDVVGNAESTCKFGALTLNRYQELETGDKCVTCRCQHPPLLTCTKTVNC